MTGLNLFALGTLGAQAQTGECEAGKAAHPEWIFCDDFEGAAPKTGTGSYFEYQTNNGGFVPEAGVGRQGSVGMRVRWAAGGVEAGSLKLAFGRNPSEYMSKGIRADEDFREIWYRMYLRMAPDWVGLNPSKLSRATVVAKEDWSQAMIAHLWSDNSGHLTIDPASCVDAQGQVECVGYNDFENLRWIGARAGTRAVFGPDDAGKWLCVEAHVRLNDPGEANGVHEFWIDGQLQARGDAYDFVGSFSDYGINAVFFENYWNAGSPKIQERYFDNLVVSTAPVGCDDGTTTPIRPPPRKPSYHPRQPLRDGLGRIFSDPDRSRFPTPFAVWAASLRPGGNELRR